MLGKWNYLSMGWSESVQCGLGTGGVWAQV